MSINVLFFKVNIGWNWLVSILRENKMSYNSSNCSYTIICRNHLVLCQCYTILFVQIKVVSRFRLLRTYIYVCIYIYATRFAFDSIIMAGKGAAQCVYLYKCLIGNDDDRSRPSFIHLCTYRYIYIQLFSGDAPFFYIAHHVCTLLMAISVWNL